jgi:hypothetical protein
MRWMTARVPVSTAMLRPAAALLQEPVQVSALQRVLARELLVRQQPAALALALVSLPESKAASPEQPVQVRAWAWGRAPVPARVSASPAACL